VYAALTHNCNNPMTETTFRVGHFLGPYNYDVDRPPSEIRTLAHEHINPITDTTTRVDHSLGTGIDDVDRSHGEIRAESSQDHSTSMQRDQIGEIALFQVGDSLFATILMLPILYSFTLPLPDRSAESIVCALDSAQIYAAMKGFHLRLSHDNCTPVWSTTGVGGLLVSCAIPIPADEQQRRGATRVEIRVDLIKDQHLLQRSATLILTVTQLITAANTHVNLLTDHVGEPGSSPTDRYTRGPPTKDNLLVSDAQHQDVRHIAAILTTAMTLRQGGTTYE